MYGLSKNTLVMGRQIITSHSHKRMILSTWPTQYHFAGIICSKYFKWMTVKGQYPMGARCTHMHTTHWGVYRIWANGIHSLRTILCWMIECVGAVEQTCAAIQRQSHFRTDYAEDFPTREIGCKRGYNCMYRIRCNYALDVLYSLWLLYNQRLCTQVGCVHSVQHPSSAPVCKKVVAVFFLRAHDLYMNDCGIQHLYPVCEVMVSVDVIEIIMNKVPALKKISNWQNIILL